MYRLTITVDEQHIFHAALENHVLTEQFVQMCPFETEFSGSGGNEVYCRLPQQLRDIDIVKVSDVKKNMICFFEAWNAMNFIYRDSNIAPYKLSYLGTVEEELAGFLEHASRNVQIKLDVGEVLKLVN